MPNQQVNMDASAQITVNEGARALPIEHPIERRAIALRFALDTRRSSSFLAGNELLEEEAVSVLKVANIYEEWISFGSRRDDDPCSEAEVML